MIKLYDLLLESYIKLTPEEKQRVEEIIPLIIKVIKRGIKKGEQYEYIDTIKYKFADGEDGKVNIFVESRPEEKYDGYFQTKDPKNKEDNYIVVNIQKVENYFNFDSKVYGALTGENKEGIQFIRRVLNHELIHAKDPALNHHFMKEPYDSNDEKIYYSSWAEFQTMTGQFFEAIITATNQALDDGVKPKKILDALQDVLDFYSGKKKYMEKETFHFIEGTNKKNFFQKLIYFATDIISSTGLTGNPYSSKSLNTYYYYLLKIKQYNTKGYREFLSDLYKAVQEAKQTVKNETGIA